MPRASSPLGVAGSAGGGMCDRRFHVHAPGSSEGRWPVSRRPGACEWRRPDGGSRSRRRIDGVAALQAIRANVAWHVISIQQPVRTRRRYLRASICSGASSKPCFARACRWRTPSRQTGSAYRATSCGPHHAHVVHAVGHHPGQHGGESPRPSNTAFDATRGSAFKCRSQPTGASGRGTTKNGLDQPS